MSADESFNPQPGSVGPHHPYDPELPFLGSLEREIRHKATRAARSADTPRGRSRGPASAHTTAPYGRSAQRPARERGDRASLPGASRIARRSLTLVALLCLIGASAFGASQILSGRSNDPAVVRQGPLALVASGHAGPDSWTLRLYRRGGDLCRVLVVAEAEASRCATAPAAGAVAVTSMVSPLRRYVFGVTGREVPQVSVRVAKLTRTVPTRAAADPSARAAGLPSGVRWFLVALPRPTHGSDPAALVRAVDTQRRPHGPTHVSCVETAEPRSCRP
jgi:hypothetical protein